MGVLLCLHLPLFTHFVKSCPLKSKIKEIASKLDNKTGANWAFSGHEFYVCTSDTIEQDGEGNRSTLLGI